MIQREIKRKKLIKKYKEKRAFLSKNVKKASTLNDKMMLSEKLQRLPKNSAKTRSRNRCWKTGKPRGYSRFFGLSRNALRELSHECLLPGVIKASW